MNIVMYKPDDLSNEQIEYFWKQEVNMDDWDYMLIFPNSLQMDHIVYDNEFVLEPVDYNIQKLLQGCCNNKWYEIEMAGDTYYVGVAYHA